MLARRSNGAGIGVRARWPGLLSAHTLAQPTPFDPIRGRVGVPTSGISRVSTPFGRGINVGSALDYITLDASYTPTGGDFSALIVGRTNASGFRFAGFVGPGDRYRWGTAGNLYFTLGGVVDVDSGLAVPSGEYLVILYSYRRLIDVSFYSRSLNTGKVMSATVACTSVPASGSENAVIGCAEPIAVGGFSWNEHLLLDARFGRAIPPGEAQKLLRNPWQIFPARRTATIAITAGAAPQLAYATSDITVASWTSSLGGALYAAIDEPTTPNDADFIFSPNNPTTEEFEVKFGSLSNPGVTTGHIVRYRAVAIGQDTAFRVTLMCGATQIAQWTDTLTVAAGATTYTKTLTTLEAAAITDYTNLRLRGRASA